MQAERKSKIEKDKTYKERTAVAWGKVCKRSIRGKGVTDMPIKGTK
jgi:hypothetical protein